MSRQPLPRTPFDAFLLRDGASHTSPTRVAPSQDVALGTFLWSSALVLLLGAALRLWDLGSVPLWKDEAFTVLVGRLPFATIVFNEIDNHPPLVYALEHVWMMFFPDLLLARVPMAVAGIATIAVVLLAMTDLCSRRAALWASLLLALSTGHIYFSQDARMYTFLVLGLSLSSWGCVGMLSKGFFTKATYAILYFLGGLIAIYSHLCGLLYLFSINMALVAMFTFEPALRRSMRSWFLANLLLGLCSIPWLLHIGRSVGTFPGLGEVTSPTVVAFFLRNALGYAGLPRWVEPPILAALALLAFAGLWTGWRDGNRTLTAVSGAGLVIYPVLLLLANEKTPILAARIFLPGVVPLAMLAGLALADRSLPRLRWSLGILLAGFALYGSASEHLVRTKRDNPSAALLAASEAGYRGSPIVTCHFFDAAGILLAQETMKAPGELYTWADTSLMRFDEKHVAAVTMSMTGLRSSSPAQIDHYLGGGYLIDGGFELLAAKSDHLVVISGGSCTEAFKAQMHAALIEAGFHRTAIQHYTRHGRVIMESGMTEAMLYARIGKPSVTVP